MKQLPEPPGSSSQPLASATPLAPASRRRLARPLPWLLALTATAGAVLVGWQRSDLLLGRLYGHWRPWLEQQVGKVMGRPLRLGAFQGVGPEGVRIGASRFLPGPEDGSSAAVGGLVVRFHPLASWRDRGLHLTLDLQDAEVDLRRKGQGPIWAFGAMAPGGKPPRIALAFRLVEPARLRLWNLGADPKPLRLDVVGQAKVVVHQQSVDWRARARQPDRPGVARLEGGGNWKSQHWHTEVLARRWTVAPMLQLLPLRGRVAGEGSGQLSLSLERGRAHCKGSLVGEGLRWQLNATAPTLSLPRAPLRCDGTTLSLAQSEWRLGSWGGRVGGDLAGRHLRLVATAQPPPSLGLGSSPLRGRLDGQIANGGLQRLRLSAERGRSRLDLAGSLTAALNLEGGWRFAPSDLPGAAKLPTWLTEAPFTGSLRLGGRLAAPRLAVVTGQNHQPLLGP